VAEVKALPHDHIECGKHSAADVIAKAQAALTESELLRAMFDIGFFSPKTPPWLIGESGAVSPGQCSAAKLRELPKQNASWLVRENIPEACRQPDSQSEATRLCHT
jgi:hypothetical protein